MKRIRSYFLHRQLREKVLLLAFVGIAAAIWLSNLSDRVVLRAREVTQTSMELKLQKDWLQKTVEIETAAKVALESWDPTRTFSAVKLNAEISTILAKVGIKEGYDIQPVQSPRSSEFADFHSVQFVARRVDYFVLESFYKELMTRAPYIGLERFLLTVSPTDANQITASFTITSVELTRQG